MKKIPQATAWLFIAGALACLSGKASGEDVPPLLTRKDARAVIANLQDFIPALLEKGRVPGLQIALIRDGKVVWHQSFGVRNVKTGEPVTEETIFEAASLTKPFFAYYIMKLVDEGTLDLDKPLMSYLPKENIEKELGHPLDAEGFRRDWFEKITPRHILSHSGGMPHGEREKVYPLFFEPGTKWKYSADGYGFLQKAVEHLKGDRLENLMKREVLDPLGMKRSYLVWKDEYEKTMANGHGFFLKPGDFRRRKEAHAGATLYTTAEEYAKFVCAVLNGRVLRRETLKDMLTSQVDMNKEMGLGWSLGFGTQQDANGPAFWQWGDYGIFRNYIIGYPGEKAAVVYLTNSFYGLSICQDIIACSLGGQALGNEALEYSHWDSPEYQFAWALKEKGPQVVEEQLSDLRKKHPEKIAPDYIRSLANTFNEENMLPEALALLEFNLKERPQSGRALADLGEAYLWKNDLKQARIFLERARDAKEDKPEAAALEWSLGYIKALENPLQLEEDYLKKLVGDYEARHLQFKEGRLFYRRDGGTFSEYRPLTAESKDTFVLQGLTTFRLKIEFDETGNPTKLVGLYADGSRDQTARDK
jgi:CubicO group peptidase (beta-lactamase class C family)